MRECMNQVVDLLNAKVPCIWIDTYEEADAIKDMREILSSYIHGMRLLVWSHTEGLRAVPLNDVEQPEPTNDRLAQPKMMFKELRQQQENRTDHLTDVWVLRDLHLLIDNHEVKRSIRDIKEYGSGNYNPIVVISPIVSIPTELEKLFTVVTYEVPSRSDIDDLVRRMVRTIEHKNNRDGKNYLIPSLAQCDQLTNACLGLTRNEILNTFSKSLVRYNELSIRAILEEKIQLVKKSGVLDYIVPQFSMDDMGGNHAFKAWVNEVIEGYSPEARAFGLPLPKGYMGFGIPGSSKTMSAEALANLLGFPLISLSMSKIMDKLVGQSERKVAQALRVVRACSPCVLLFDEVEKMLGGVQSSNQSDSGTTSRVMAEILKFLNEDNGVFVVMTSNDVSQLPPEFDRAGRLDTRWYFSLPTFDERKEIFRIHVEKTGKEVNDSVIAEAAKAAENYTGAEIREVVKVSLRKAYQRYKQDGNNTITAEDMKAAVKDVVPLYRSSREKILLLENYAHGRARFANEESMSAAASSQNDELIGELLELGG